MRAGHLGVHRTNVFSGLDGRGVPGFGVQVAIRIGAKACEASEAAEVVIRAVVLVGCRGASGFDLHRTHRVHYDWLRENLKGIGHAPYFRLTQRAGFVLLDDFAERVKTDGLGDEIIHAGGEAAFAFTCECVGSQRENRKA